MTKTNRIYFYLAVSTLVVLASLANGLDEPLEAKLLEPSPDFVGKPILKTGEMAKKAYDFLNKKNEETNAVEAKEVKPAEKVEEKKPEPIVDPIPPGGSEPVPEPPVDESNLIRLPPIMPMLGGMSPFLQSILSSAKNMGQNFDADTNINEHEHDFEPNRPHGVMTIVLIKSSKSKQNGDEENEAENGAEAALSKIRPNLNFLLQNILPRRFSQLFGGETDQADREMFGRDDDMMINRRHQLLGGEHDIDRLRYEQQNQQLIGAEEQLINSNPLLAFRTNHGINGNIMLEEEMNKNDVRPPPKKCMMMSFMRLKASAYYRTVVHLLFFSGIILLFLFMIMLTIRVYKRRRALRYYNHNLNVATISNDDLPPKNGSSNMFRFRLGNLRNSYAQRKADSNTNEAINNNNFSSSLLFYSPPAYEKVISVDSSKLNTQNSSLAKAYKKEADEDAKSTTSLPAYNDALAKNAADI